MNGIAWLLHVSHVKWQPTKNDIFSFVGRMVCARMRKFFMSYFDSHLYQSMRCLAIHL